MYQDIIARQLGHTLKETSLTFGTRYNGKVRDTYRTTDHLILVASDRISAFDHILRQTIPFKGQVLTQTAAHFFKHTADVMPNHIIAVPDPNVTVAIPCEPIPIEFVVRGYLAGHAWREYHQGKRTLCGVNLPEGLQQNSRLPHPILTPATKATEGHDEDISHAEIIRRGLLSEDELQQLEAYALALFARGTVMAAERGLILVDTKYEFGRTSDGRYIAIDEIHTPDSSRYFYADTYEALLAQNKPQRQLSKEFVREWLMEHGFQGKKGQVLPDLTDAFRIVVAQRYIELYEAITGEVFIPETSERPEARIHQNVQSYLDLQ